MHNNKRYKTCQKRYNYQLFFVSLHQNTCLMMSILGKVLSIIGEDVAIEEWQGKLYCTEFNAEISLKVNKTGGFVYTYMFILVTKGWMKILFDGRELTLNSDEMHFYTPTHSFVIIEVSENLQGFCLFVDEQVAFETPASYDLIQAYLVPVIHLNEPKIRLSPDMAAHIKGRMQEIIRYLHSDHIYRTETLKMLFTIFVFDLQNTQKNILVNQKVSKRTEEIFIAFIRILPLYFEEHHDINFYASKLNISAVYLSRAVKQAGGHTVAYHIDKALLSRASFLLLTTSLSIAQIAYRLHFADPPSFSKFFSRMMGCSPRVFREAR